MQYVLPQSKAFNQRELYIHKVSLGKANCLAENIIQITILLP